MKGLARAALYQIRLWPTSLLFWWLMLLAPLLAIGTIAWLLGSGSLYNLPLALCDEDRTPLSRQVARWVDAAPSMHITCVVTSPEEGHRLLRQGKVSGLVLIPRNFERDILRKRPAQIQAYVEGQHMAVAGILNRDMSDLGLSLWRSLDIDNRLQTGIPAYSAMAQSSTVSLDLRPIANPGTNYRLFLLPGLLPALIQLALTLMTVWVLHKTADDSHPQLRDIPAWQLIGGSLLPIVLWCWVLLCGIAGLMIHTNDLVLRGSIGILYASYLLFCLAGAAVGILIFGLTPQLIRSLSFVSAFSAPAFAFAGLTFPIMSMPLIGRMWAALLPLTHMLTIQVKCGQLGASVSSQLPAFTALFLLAGMGIILGMPLATRQMQRRREEVEKIYPRAAPPQADPPVGALS